MSPLGEYTFVTVGGQVDTSVLIPAKNTNRSLSVEPPPHESAIKMSNKCIFVEATEDLTVNPGEACLADIPVVL